jgi:aspartate/methionine/tyrosine aminotransferase
METWISERTKNIVPSASVSIADKIRQMKRKGLDIIELQTGEPDFATPEHIVKAAYEAMQQGYTHYVSSRGVPELREAIAEKLWSENNIKADPEREILVTPGAIHAVFAAAQAVINAGDEVIIPDPCWVAYPGCVALSGGIVVMAPCQKGSLEIDVERLREAITPKTKLLILNYPSNPTGTTATLDQLERIAHIAIEHNLLVLSDEVYEKILYDGKKHYSIASLEGMQERTITINGFSKTYAMTGWRIGYVHASMKIMDQMLKVQQYSVTCASAFVQKAAIAALRGSQECVQGMVREYDRRRQVIVAGLNTMSRISCSPPHGTFYVFADISQLGLSSVEAAEFLLNTAKVGVVPGSAYGPSGEGYVRLSFANSIENIEKALYQIKEAIIVRGT